eukprot:338597_1
MEDVMEDERRTTRKHMECMKHEILMAMRSSFRKNNERTMLLQKLDELRHQQHDLELQYKMSRVKKQQQRDLNRERNTLMQKQIEWQHKGDDEHDRRRDETEKLLEREHQMRVEEHKKLMNG